MEEVKKKVINIYPTRAARRILVFFADLLILFIASVFLYEIAINPLSSLAIKYNEKYNEALVYSKTRTQILYDNELLFFDEENNKYEFTKNVEYTAEIFLKYYVFDSKTLQNEVIFHYFSDIKYKDLTENKEEIVLEKVNSIYEKEGSKYFDLTSKNELGTYNLKSNYIELFTPYYDETDELSEEGKKEFSSFKENCFLNIYSYVIEDIIENDLKTNLSDISYSYNELSALISNYDSFSKNYVVVTVYITYALCAIVLYFVIPLTNKKGRTLSEMILKVERVDIKSIEYLKKRFVVAEGLFNTLQNLSVVFLIPVISYGFSNLFRLNYLYIVSFIALIFCLIEMFFVIFSNYTQSLKELSTHSICCDTSTIDTYYREKGYDF